MSVSETTTATTTRPSHHRRSSSLTSFSAKFEDVVAPSRRPPPTSLRLISGPLPPRNQPRHTLPSFPRPAFHPKLHVVLTGPIPRKITKDAMVLEQEVPAIHLANEKYPPLSIPSYYAAADSDSDGNSSPTSPSGSDLSSGPSSPVGERGLRGPWNHAGGIKVPFDIVAVLPLPRRAAVSIPQRV